MQQILILFFFATFIEGFVKYIVDGLGEARKEKIKYLIPYFTLLIGLALAVNFQLDIFKIFEYPLVSTFPLVSYIITGVIIGRWSNYINDLITKLRLKTVDNSVDPA